MTVLNPSCSEQQHGAVPGASPSFSVTLRSHGSGAREQHLAGAHSAGCVPHVPVLVPVLVPALHGVAGLGCDLRSINFSCSSSTQSHPPPQQRVSMNSWAHYKHVSINNCPH